MHIHTHLEAGGKKEQTHTQTHSVLIYLFWVLSPSGVTLTAGEGVYRHIVTV